MSKCIDSVSSQVLTTEGAYKYEMKEEINNLLGMDQNWRYLCELMISNTRMCMCLGLFVCILCLYISISYLCPLKG